MPTTYLINPDQNASLQYCRYESDAICYDLNLSVGAEVHDALWMLTQQWRVGEFKGSDGGSATKAKIKIDSEKISKYSLFNKTESGSSFTTFSTAENLDQDSKPINTIIESIKFDPDILLRIQLGKQWLRILQKHVLGNTYNNNFLGIATLLIASPSTTDYENLSDSEAAILLSVTANTMLDGYKLYQNSKASPGSAKLNIWPPPPSGPAPSPHPDEPLVDAAEFEFVEYVERLVDMPTEEAWDNSALEYKYKLSSYDGTDETVLVGDKHQSGNLDWYDVDIDANSSSLSNTTRIPESTIEEIIPVPVTFKGMPVERWWQFEDKNIDLASMPIKKTDLGKLMVMEFGLIYSNDWFVIPYEVKVGSLLTVNTLVVTDSFGKYTSVKAAGVGSNDTWKRWSMFNLNQKGAAIGAPADTRLFIPPSVVKQMESDPIEQVFFVRDEMANLVWGLEEIVPNPIYGGKRGNIAEVELLEYLTENNVYTTTDPSGLIENAAEVKFSLMNRIPENWIPFIPAATGNTSRSIQFQRATMPRLIEGYNTMENVRPRTSLLSEGINGGTSYFINEEEITRPGAIVKTTFQRARWYNGESYVWLGRVKTIGRGEANSSLEYDTIISKD